MSYPPNKPPQAYADVTCSVSECPNAAAKASYCWAHYKRKMRGRPLSPPVRRYTHTAWDGLRQAIDEFSDFMDQVGEKDAMAAWKRAQERLRWALRTYNAKKRRRQAPGA